MVKLQWWGFARDFLAETQVLSSTWAPPASIDAAGHLLSLQLLFQRNVQRPCCSCQPCRDLLGSLKGTSTASDSYCCSLLHPVSLYPDYTPLPADTSLSQAPLEWASLVPLESKSVQTVHSGTFVLRREGMSLGQAQLPPHHTSLPELPQLVVYLHIAPCTHGPYRALGHKISLR